VASSRDWGSVVLVDLDGTLVDSVYHHVLAWDAALAERGYRVALRHIHSAIGMGGERLLPWLLGEHVDDADALIEEHKSHFLRHTDRLRATRGARALVADLRARAVPFLVATSAGGAVGQSLLAALGVDDLPTADADDVGAPKPAPDLLLAACDTLGADPAQATVVGDSPWDAEAAERAGARAVTVRCGGFGDEALRAAGAPEVVDDPRALVGRL
jgi:HAD superfamily hydrolase (TIGR01509 family)